MRAVLDVNVVISAGLSPSGTPAQILRAWLEGTFELVVSQHLLDELEHALAYPKLRARISASDASELVDFLRRGAIVVDDPEDAPTVRSPDPADDYLIALAQAARAVIVSGDAHLLGLAGSCPVLSPAEFARELQRA